MTKEEAEQLRAANAALRAENAALKEELAAVNRRLDALVGFAASQNQQLSELADMLRRRLQRAPKPASEPPDDGPEDDPPSGGVAVDPDPVHELDLKQRPSRGRGRKKGDKRSRSGRNQLPQHLPVDEERHRPDVCTHCGSGRLLARDWEVTEKLDIIKEHVRRRQIRREVRVCTCCNKTTTAGMPPMPRPRAGYTCAFLAWLVFHKFVLLVPLDRIRRVLASQGIELSMGTLVSLIEWAADLLGPIDGQHWKERKAGAWLALDGTGLKTMVDWLPTTWLGNLDIFTRDTLAVYQFSMTKHGDELALKLAGFEGTVLCDAESRNGAALGEGCIEANCNAHPRRKFRDAERAQPKLAKEAGAFLTRMYAVETHARRRGLVGDDLLALRQNKTRPIVERFRTWLKKAEPDLLPTDPLGKAVRYYLNHFDALTRFVDDANLPIDNNRSERGFQNHAKLRLNSLFAGSPEGAHRWALILGVVETATRVGVDVFAYLIWVFERRGTWKKRFGMAADQLTPAAYKKQAREEAQARASAA